MARPSRRSPVPHYVPFRLSTTEYSKLEELAAACRMTKSEVLRSLLAKQAPLKPSPPARTIFDHKALVELSRIGNNINQIARELHKHDRQDIKAEEFQQLDRALLQLCALVLLGPEKATMLASEGFKEFMPYIRVKPSFNQPRP